MKVMRFPKRDDYHLHRCRNTVCSSKSALMYDIEYADSFWEPCIVCLHERAEACLTENSKSKDDVVDDVERYYDEFGEWPSKYQLCSERGYVDRRTINKYVDSFRVLVDEVASRVDKEAPVVE